MSSDVAHYVCDIPIYLWPQERYDKAMSEDTEKVVQSLIRDTEEGPDLAESLRRAAGMPASEEKIRVDESIIQRWREASGRDKWEELGGPWQFNQIVGWIRVYVGWRGLGGHLWMAKGKRLQRKTRRRFRLESIGNCLPGVCTDAVSSRVVYENLLTELQAMGKDIKRHLDLSVFERIGPYVDWRKLLDDVAGH